MRFFWRFRAPNLDPPRRISSFGTSLEEWVRTNYTFVAFKDLSDFLLQKSVSLFLGKKSLETHHPLQPVFWNASRLSENSAGFLESRPCSTKDLTQQWFTLQLCHLDLGENVKRREGKNRVTLKLQQGSFQEFSFEVGRWRWNCNFFGGEGWMVEKLYVSKIY